MGLVGSTILLINIQTHTHTEIHIQTNAHKTTHEGLLCNEFSYALYVTVNTEDGLLHPFSFH